MTNTQPHVDPDSMEVPETAKKLGMVLKFVELVGGYCECCMSSAITEIDFTDGSSYRLILEQVQEPQAVEDPKPDGT